MKKLKLESLEVTSFETSAMPEGRGTLRAHEDGPLRPPKDSNFDCTVFYCPSTPQMDCTFGCSRNTDCDYNCTIVRLTETDCGTL